MKQIICTSLAALLAGAGMAYDISIRCDTQFPDTQLRSLPMAQGFAATVQALALENGKVNTNIASHTARLLIGTSATAASFITATSTVTTASSGKFTIPVSAEQSNTNGTFWYSILFYDATGGGPYYAGTGTCTIAETTASSATSAPSLLIPLALGSYDITGAVPLANLSGITSNQMAAATVAAFLDAGTGTVTSVTGNGYVETDATTGDINVYLSTAASNVVANALTNGAAFETAGAAAALSNVLGTAAYTDSGDYATAAQGDSATNALARVALVEAEVDVLKTNTATAAQGALADSAVQTESDPVYSAWVTNSAAGSTNAILPDGTLVDVGTLLGSGGGVTDHGALTGLDDEDDHAWAVRTNDQRTIDLSGATVLFENDVYEADWDDSYLSVNRNSIWDAFGPVAQYVKTNDAAYLAALTNAAFAAQDGITFDGRKVNIGTNLFTGGGAATGDWWTNAPDSAVTVATNTPVAGDSLFTSDGTNLYWATPAGAGDMLAATYDPAGGAEQVAFASVVATQFVTVEETNGWVVVDTCNLDNATGDGSADFTNAVQTAQIGLIAYAPRTNTLVTSTDTNLTLASSYQQTLVITNNPCTLLWTNTIEDLYTIWVDYGTNSVTWPTNWTFWLDSQPEDGTSNAVISVGKAHDVGWYVIGGAK